MGDGDEMFKDFQYLVGYCQRPHATLGLHVWYMGTGGTNRAAFLTRCRSDAEAAYYKQFSSEPSGYEYASDASTAKGFAEAIEKLQLSALDVVGLLFGAIPALPRPRRS